LKVVCLWLENAIINSWYGIKPFKQQITHFNLYMDDKSWGVFLCVDYIQLCTHTLWYNAHSAVIPGISGYDLIQQQKTKTKNNKKQYFPVLDRSDF